MCQPFFILKYLQRIPVMELSVFPIVRSTFLHILISFTKLHIIDKLPDFLFLAFTAYQ